MLRMGDRLHLQVPWNHQLDMNSRGAAALLRLGGWLP